MNFTRTFISCIFVLFSSYSLGFATDAQTPSEVCDSLVRTIKKVSVLHLTAPLELDSEVFSNAQTKLKNKYNIKEVSPASFSAYPACAETLIKIKRAVPRQNIKDLALELLNYYISHWDPHSRAGKIEELIGPSRFHSGYGLSLSKLNLTRPADIKGREYIEVSDVIEGSPADNAGLTEGMLISELNGKKASELTNVSLNKILNDPKLNQVTLTLESLNEIKKIVLERDQFEVSPVQSDAFIHFTPHDLYRKEVGYIKLRRIDDAAAAFAVALRTLQHCEALILDLRNLFGGDIEAASVLTDMLVSGVESFAGFIGRIGKLENVLSFKNQNKIWDLPIVVLVNEKTKSAGEMIAGALQDFGSPVVGSKTFGKGTAQSRLSLAPDFDGEIVLTHSLVVRPSGKLIQGKGIQPDLVLLERNEAIRESDKTNFIRVPYSLEFELRRAPYYFALPGYDLFDSYRIYPKFTHSRDEIAKKVHHEIQLKQALGQSQSSIELDLATDIAIFLSNEY